MSICRGAGEQKKGEKKIKNKKIQSPEVGGLELPPLVKALQTWSSMKHMHIGGWCALGAISSHLSVIRFLLVLRPASR
jgi:hypothetical protein